MSLQHFFLNEQILKTEIEVSDNCFILDLSDEDVRHAKVLRLKTGEHIGVIDADSIYYECEVLEFNNCLRVKNCGKQCKNLENVQVWLCPGLSKGNKLDDVVRGSTEVGIFGFIPTIFERSIVKLDQKKESAKVDRLKKIAKSAAMQSGQFRIPKLNDFVTVNELCNVLKDFNAVFICWEEAESLKDIVEVCNKLKRNKEKTNIAVVVGPEGGITKEEVMALKNCNKHTYVVSIGNSILRTETAAIVASAIIKFNLTC